LFFAFLKFLGDARLNFFVLMKKIQKYTLYFLKKNKKIFWVFLKKNKKIFWFFLKKNKKIFWENFLENLGDAD
jgi:hypothetical protein